MITATLFVVTVVAVFAVAFALLGLGLVVEQQLHRSHRREHQSEPPDPRTFRHHPR
jgi:hypothetical protein